MYEEQSEAPSEVSFIAELARFFTIIFTMSILAMALTGVLIARYIPEAQDMSALFALKGAGLSYSTILQIAGLSIILAVFCVLITSDRFLVKTRFVFRFFLFLLAAFFSTSIFAFIFKWFPVDNLLAWIRYLLSTTICFAIASGITLFRFKLENKKYNRLLEIYKAKRKDNQGTAV